RESARQLRGGAREVCGFPICAPEPRHCVRSVLRRLRVRTPALRSVQPARPRRHRGRQVDCRPSQARRKEMIGGCCSALGTRSRRAGSPPWMGLSPNVCSEQLPALARRGGRDIKKNEAKPPLMQRTGRLVQLPIIGRVNKPPRLRGIMSLREIFLIAQPPLLVQGGEFALPIIPRIWRRSTTGWIAILLFICILSLLPPTPARAQQPDPVLVVQKSGPATMNLGAWGNFGLDVQNTGQSDAWNLSLHDVLP